MDITSPEYLNVSVEMFARHILTDWRFHLVNRVKGVLMSPRLYRLYGSPDLRYSEPIRPAFKLLCHYLHSPACLHTTVHRLYPQRIFLPTHHTALSVLSRPPQRLSTLRLLSSRTSSPIVHSLPRSTMTATLSQQTVLNGYFPVPPTFPRRRWPLCTVCKPPNFLPTATTTAHWTASAS